MPGKNQKHLTKSLLSSLNDTPPNSPKSPILKINNNNNSSISKNTTKDNNNSKNLPQTTITEETTTVPQLTASAITPTFPPVFFPLTPSSSRGGWRGSMGGATDSTRLSITYDDNTFDLNSTGNLICKEQSGTSENAKVKGRADTFFSGQVRYSLDDRTDFQKSSRSKRRGVVISLGIDQLRSTVITPEHLSYSWDIRSYGLFRRQAAVISTGGGSKRERSHTLK